MTNNRILRSLVVGVALVTWLAISNHCAIAAMEGVAQTPMPSCHGMAAQKQVPDKHSPESGMECCKVLRSTLVTPLTDLAAYDALAFALQNYVGGNLRIEQESQELRVIKWDTGPPGFNSFAESVLQRSIFAHAPPSRA